MTAVKNEQKEKNEPKGEEQKETPPATETKEKKFKPINFVRRDLRPGVYSTNALGHRIQIKDRNNYIAKNKSEIEFLNDDPELMILRTGKKKEKK